MAAARPAPEPTHEMNTIPRVGPSDVAGEPPVTGSATLKTIRLSSSDPPLSVILELTGPVHFEKSLESNADGRRPRLWCSRTSHRMRAAASSGVRQVDFQRLRGIERFFGNDDNAEHAGGRGLRSGAISLPPRLLMSFTPQAGTLKTSRAD